MHEREASESRPTTPPLTSEETAEVEVAELERKIEAVKARKREASRAAGEHEARAAAAGHQAPPPNAVPLAATNPAATPQAPSAASSPTPPVASPRETEAKAAPLARVPTESIGAWTAPDLTDPAMAERFAATAKDRLRFVVDQRVWRAWDGKRWVPDDGQLRHRVVIEQMRQLQAEAHKAPDQRWQQRIWAYSVRGQESHRVQSIVRTSESDPAIQSRSDAFDADADLLNVQNGIVDLRTGKVLPHDPKKLMTRICPVPYEPAAKADAWIAFLLGVIPDVEVINFIQRAAGMSASGHGEREHGAILLHGDGANGKGTFTRAVMDALGDYADAATTGLLLAAATDKGDFESADLRGKRMVVATETREGGTLNEARFKRLVGGDRIKGRNLYEGFGVGWTPTHTIWLESNHLPKIRGQDEGIWRRIHLVDFPIVHRLPNDIRPERQHLPVIDHLLGEKIRRELPGVLAWVVAGAVAWTLNGLNPPAAVQAATGVYREEQDVVSRWVAECSLLEVARMGGEVSRKDIGAAIARRAEEEGETRPTDRAVTKALKAAGFEVRIGSKGARFVRLAGPAPTQGVASC